MARSSPLRPPAQQPGRALRAAALTAVIAGVLVLAAAAFVLSYSGIHAIARQSGISAQLARGYPVIIDAMLVIAGAAVLALRGAGWPSRLFAWLVLLVLLAAVAGAGAVHSVNAAIPHRAAAAAAIVLPWFLLLVGFGLLLAMLRHFRLHRAAAARAAQPGQPAPAQPGAVPPGRPQLPAGPAAAAQAAPGQPTGPGQPTAPGQQSGPGQAAGPGGPAGADDAGAAAPDAAYPGADGEQPAEEIYAAPPAEDGYAGPAGDQPAAGAAPQPGPQPAFHRMWSSPTPPGEGEEEGG